MNKKVIRDYIRLFSALIFFILYVPHIFAYCVKWSARKKIQSDLFAIDVYSNLRLKNILLMLLYQLHNNRWFRTLFYYRVGPIFSVLISWIRPGDKTFMISFNTSIGEGMRIAHSYASVINAESIGKISPCYIVLL